MPIRRRSRRRVTRRPTRKRQALRGRRASRKVPRSIGPPPHQFAKLNYAKINTFTVAPATIDARAWNINSLYDPDASFLLGIQPYFFDQYSLMYNLYRVFGCKVTVRLSTAANTTNLYAPTVILAPVPSGVLVTPTSIPDNLIDYPMAQFRNVVPSQSVTTFKAYYPVSRVQGVSKKEVATDDRYSATISTNPSILPSLQVIIVNNETLGGATVAVTYEVRITYYAKFFGLNRPGAS